MRRLAVAGVMLALTLPTAGSAIAAPGPAATSPAGAGSRLNGYWFAWNDDRQPVSFEIRHRSIISFSTSLRAYCYSGRYLLFPEFPPPFSRKKTIPIGANGNFRTSFRGSGRASLKDNTQTIKGSLRDGRIRGSFSIKGICTGRASFSAYRLGKTTGSGS